MTRVGTTGDAVTDDKMQPNVNERSEQAKPQPVDQHAQQGRASAVAQPGQRTAPRRKPLFRS